MATCRITYSLVPGSRRAVGLPRGQPGCRKPPQAGEPALWPVGLWSHDAGASFHLQTLTVWGSNFVFCEVPSRLTRAKNVMEIGSWGRQDSTRPLWATGLPSRWLSWLLQSWSLPTFNFKVSVVHRMLTLCTTHFSPTIFTSFFPLVVKYI